MGALGGFMGVLGERYLLKTYIFPMVFDDFLGDPWGDLGGPWGVLWGPWGVLGNPWKVLGGPWGRLGGLWGVLGGPLGAQCALNIHIFDGF